jgi:hypothetical protein
VCTSQSANIQLSLTSTRSTPDTIHSVGRQYTEQSNTTFSINVEADDRRLGW